MAVSLTSARVPIQAWHSQSAITKNVAIKAKIKSECLVSTFASKLVRTVPKTCRRRTLTVTNSSSSTSVKISSTELKQAKEEVIELVKKTYSNPILIRLGWHDSGTYNKDVKEWPKCGGANGSIRFTKEMGHAANAGLQGALKLLDPIKEKFPSISYADLFQLASVTAIELAGGPKVPMRYGRVDTTAPEECPEEGMLPDAGAPSPAKHLRNVFYRMGFSDKSRGIGQAATDKVYAAKDTAAEKLTSAKDATADKAYAGIHRLWKASGYKQVQGSSLNLGSGHKQHPCYSSHKTRRCL